MLLLSHVTTGAVIGATVNDPGLVILTVTASHFLLDAIPHWSYEIPKRLTPWEFFRILPDVFPAMLVFIAFLFSYPDQWLAVTLGVAFAILPDFLTLTKHLPGLRTLFARFNKFHEQIQPKDKLVRGLIIQAVFLGILMTWFVWR